MSDELFADLDRRPVNAAPTEGPLRLETPNRTQVELVPTDLEALLPLGHAARLVWRFVEGLDLRRFQAAIRSREGRAGRAATDPRVLLALVLYATIKGIGSAREIARLCYSDDAYRWLRGGVGINHHTLSDFRMQHQAALDDLVTQSITVLLERRVVTLTRVTQDGTKVRANAGMRSFRRADRLQACAQAARAQVRAVAAAAAEGGETARALAAQRRAAAEQVARVDEALAQLPAVEAAKQRNRSKAVARVSTTDPDARVMKMPDGGYRPAYNVQFATDMASDVVVGVAVTNTGSDQQALIPMQEQIAQRTGVTPAATLADGGYVSTEGIQDAAARGTTLYTPIPKKNAPGSGSTAGQDAAVTAWRDRMTTEAAKAVYRARAGTAERLNADTRVHRTLATVPVRGLTKVLMWALWAALAQNMMRTMAIVPHLMT